MKKMIAALVTALGVGMLGVIPVQAQTVTMPDGTQFDPEYYAAQNPDVVNSFGTSTDMLYLHYSVCGKAEGRLPVAPTYDNSSLNGFDAAYYAARYPDIYAAFGNDAALLALHYTNCGVYEGRYPNAAAEAAALEAQRAAEEEAARKAAEEEAARLQAEQQQEQAIATSYEREVFNLVNQERAAAGLPALSWASDLEQAVNIRAQELTTYYSHTRPDGRRCFTVFDDLGIRRGACAENIAEGYTDPAHVMNGWMNSSGHRANILGGYTEMAVGFAVNAYGRNEWVQMFVYR